jgi:integrase
VYRLLAGTFALGVRRGILTRNPVDGLAPAERPKQRNAKRVAVPDGAALATFVAAGSTERSRAALALAAYAGCRLGEIRGLTWADCDTKKNTIVVRRSLLPDGTAKDPKTDAGKSTIPMLPALRRELLVWKIKAPHKSPHDLVIGTAEGTPVEERNLRRAFADAKDAAKIDVGEARLSWHSLRHSAASMLATELELPATTLAAVIGHTDAGFTLRVYARENRDAASVVPRRARPSGCRGRWSMTDRLACTAFRSNARRRAALGGSSSALAEGQLAEARAGCRSCPPA